MVESFKFIKTIFDAHHQRNTDEVVNRLCCGRNTNEFVRFNKEHLNGSWSGSCGVRKDKNRVYCCKPCFRSVWNKR